MLISATAIARARLASLALGALCAGPALSQTVDFAEPTPLVLATGFESDLDLAIDPSGAAHIAYVFNEGDRDVFYMTNLSGAWTAPVRLSAGFADEHLVSIVALGSGQAVAVWRSRQGNQQIQAQRLVGGAPVGPDFRVDRGGGSDTPLDATAIDSSSWAVLARRAQTTIDELVVFHATTAGEVTDEILALGLTDRFLEGRLARGPDGVLHAAVRLAGRESGSVTRLAYTNDRSGSFAPLTDLLSDARGADIALHVDDFNRVYAHARTPTESRIRVSLDGGETFPSTVNLGAMDVWLTAGRPDGLDVFENDEIDVNMILHRVTGTAVDPPMDAPTPDWRAADIEFFGGDHFAATSGTLQFTSTLSAAPGQLGDLDFNGLIDVADVVRLVNALVGTQALPVAGLIRADLDGDLRLTSEDLVQLVALLLHAPS